MTDIATIAAPIAHPDAAIMELWSSRQAAYARFNALPMMDGPGEPSPEEDAELYIIDMAEDAIRATLATTLRGVAVQLWIAFQHHLTDRTDDAEAQATNLAYFADDEHRDWTERMTLAALRSLAAQGVAL